MLNDVIFNGTVSAYEKWGLTLTEVKIPLPTPKTFVVDIKGADGLLDLTEALSGDVKFSNRVIKLDFEMMDSTEYYSLVSDISAYIHAKNISVRLTKDDYYYVGRAVINDWECIKQKGKIVVTVDCEPYKYAVRETVAQVTLTNETKTIILPNKRMKVMPMLTSTGDLTMTFKDTSYTLGQMNDAYLLNFFLEEGDNVITLEGTGTVKFTYRMGAL